MLFNNIINNIILQSKSKLLIEVFNIIKHNLIKKHYYVF